MHEVCVLRNKIGLEIIFKFFESKKRQDVSDDLKSHIGDLKKKRMKICIRFIKLLIKLMALQNHFKQKKSFSQPLVQ